MIAILCWLFDHEWVAYMIRGNNGEPGEAKCTRCHATEPRYNMPCRCLLGCKCDDYDPLFVFEADPAFERLGRYVTIKLWGGGVVTVPENEIRCS